MSESVAKAPRAGIGGEKKRGISTILLRHPGSIRAFATDLDNSTPRTPARTAASAITPASGSARPAPGRRDVHFALERALLTAHLEGEMHLSRAKCTSRRAQDRPAHHHPERLPPAPPRAASHRPGPRTTTPGEKGSMGWRLACRDAADLLGPLAFRWTTWFTKYGGPTAHKWSKQKSASTSPPATPRPVPTSPPAEQPSGRAGPRPRAVRTTRASRASISLSRPMRACGDFSEPGAYGSSAAYSPSPGRLEFNARSSAVCMPPTTTASDDSRQPPPVPDVPGISPAVKSGGPVSGRRPRGRAAMCAGTAGTRPAGDSPCADAGLTVTLRHLLG